MPISRRTGWTNRLFASSRGRPRDGRGRAERRLELEPCEDRILMASLLLGTAQGFAVLGGSAVTNTGPSAIVGDLGVNPGTAVSGFPPGLLIGGTAHVNDAVALQAQTDLTSAYDVIAGEPFQGDLTGQDLGGRTLTPGVYHFSSSAQLTGALILDAMGDPDARFDFQIGSTLTTASASTVLLINGADACSVYWQVGSSATLGTASTFQGNILALTSITLNTGATIPSGRALARNGSVTLDTNSISNVCLEDVIPPVTPPVDPPVTPPAIPPGTPPVAPPTGKPPAPTSPAIPPTGKPAIPPPAIPPLTPPVDKLPTNPPTTIPPVRVPVTAPINTPTVNAGSPGPPKRSGASTQPTIQVRRFGIHKQPTTLVLSFSTPLDPARARDIGNYRITTVGGPGRDGADVGHSIGVKAAFYNLATQTVVLRPAEQLDVHNTYRLTVKGTAPAGQAGPTGVPLGRNSSGLITRSTLDGPAPTTLRGYPSRRSGTGIGRR